MPRPDLFCSLGDVFDREHLAGSAVLARLRRDVVGLDTRYPVVGGRLTRRVYLDSAASTLRLAIVQRVLECYLPHYANTHSTLHYAARLSTVEYAWAHRMVLEFFNADAARFMCFFAGSGTTAGLNRVARTLRHARPGRDLVVTSIAQIVPYPCSCTAPGESA